MKSKTINSLFLKRILMRKKEIINMFVTDIINKSEWAKWSYLNKIA